MKKKVSSRLTLGKRSVATLSEELMSQVNGGYSETCPTANSCGCPPPPTRINCGSGGSGSGTYAAYTQPRCC
jgi:hypothetical protein